MKNLLFLIAIAIYVAASAAAPVMAAESLCCDACEKLDNVTITSFTICYENLCKDVYARGNFTKSNIYLPAKGESAYAKVGAKQYQGNKTIRMYFDVFYKDLVVAGTGAGTGVDAIPNETMTMNSGNMAADLMAEMGPVNVQVNLGMDKGLLAMLTGRYKCLAELNAISKLYAVNSTTPRLYISPASTQTTKIKAKSGEKVQLNVQVKNNMTDAEAYPEFPALKVKAVAMIDGVDRFESSALEELLEGRTEALQVLLTAPKSGKHTVTLSVEGEDVLRKPVLFDSSTSAQQISLDVVVCGDGVCDAEGGGNAVKLLRRLRLPFGEDMRQGKPRVRRVPEQYRLPAWQTVRHFQKEVRRVPG